MTEPTIILLVPLLWIGWSLSHIRHDLRSILSPAQQGNEFSLSRQQERMDDVARQGGGEK